MTTKVLYELLTNCYERFVYFSRAWILTIAKNSNVNQKKSKHHAKLNFNQEKIQKM